MFSVVGTILSMIPGLSSLVQSIINAWFNAKVTMYTSRWGVTRDVAISAILAEKALNDAKVSWLQVIAGSPVLSFVVVGFAFPFIFYLNKVIVWDICLGLGSTPMLKYDLLTQWGGVIIGGIFLSAGSVGIAHAVINKKD